MRAEGGCSHSIIFPTYLKHVTCIEGSHHIRADIKRKFSYWQHKYYWVGWVRIEKCHFIDGTSFFLAICCIPPLLFLLTTKQYTNLDQKLNHRLSLNWSCAIIIIIIIINVCLSVCVANSRLSTVKAISLNHGSWSYTIILNVSNRMEISITWIISERNTYVLCKRAIRILPI